MTPDPQLRIYAHNDEQWEKYCAWHQFGSKRKAADNTEWSESAIQRAKSAIERNAARHGYAPEQGFSQDNVPSGFALDKVSMLTDLRSGEQVLRWDKMSREREAQEAFIREAVEAMCEDLPRMKPRTTKPKIDNDELMTVIPMGDPHFGMYAHASETGESFDLTIAKRDLCAAVDYLVGQSPPSKRCVLINLGDFFHCDNRKNTTNSGNVLDVDSRMSKVISVGVAALRQCIESALDRHETVEIINVIGNHDEVLSLALDAIFLNTYENEPRVVVHAQPTPRHYIQHGKVLIGATHGDRTKDRDLPGIMATEKPVQWGETTTRYFYRGHHHHDTLEMLNGCTVEQFSTLAPNDAWHHAGGYLTGRNMKLIVHHKEFGEVSRSVCSIDMLRSLAQ